MPYKSALLFLFFPWDTYVLSPSSILFLPLPSSCAIRRIVNNTFRHRRELVGSRGVLSRSMQLYAFCLRFLLLFFSVSFSLGRTCMSLDRSHFLQYDQLWHLWGQEQKISLTVDSRLHYFARGFVPNPDFPLFRPYVYFFIHQWRASTPVFACCSFSFLFLVRPLKKHKT
ncbi:unnamed protein product [Hapterophycus canaliculatus]